VKCLFLSESRNYFLNKPYGIGGMNDDLPKAR
jgi:hypothetical protein